jgi:dTDP-4-amino-4,6-dideoxygalactose transaminase
LEILVLSFNGNKIITTGGGAGIINKTKAQKESYIFCHSIL